MKATILSILLFLSVNAQNIWYVDRDASGSANGTSWANAWNRLDQIAFGSLSAGDTVYVSGGNDSTTYLTNYTGVINCIEKRSPRYTFASGNPVVIARAWESGHNGQIYFTRADTSVAYRYVFHLEGISNIKFYGLNFYNLKGGSRYAGLAYLGGSDQGNYTDSLQYFENCSFVDSGYGGLVYMAGCKITLKNCWLEEYENWNLKDSDPLAASGGRGGHTIDGCTIIQYNHANSDAHRDMIQISDWGVGSENLDFKICNNMIINRSPDGTAWNALIYSPNRSGNNRFLIYNNIVVTKDINTVGGMFIYGDGLDYLSVRIYNNTILLQGDGGVPMVTDSGIDTLIIKNNLIIVDSTTDHLVDVSDAVQNENITIDYNCWGMDGGASGALYYSNSGVRTFAQWQSEGYDLNGFTVNSTNVTWVDKYDTSRTDYYTTTGRDLGDNISAECPECAYDALGNPRTGSWDMGALEYQGNQSNNIKVNSKIYLQGPFITNSMSTSLTQSSLLPSSQPYNSPPWNYNGNENFNPGSNPTIVDWVLVELRNASNPIQVVTRRAALLKNNGLILETNGTEGVTFNNNNSGSYYIAIYHRNHLAIMSASPVSLSSNSTLYDFTTAMNKAYGQNPMVQLGAGKYGMYATDGNADGVVNTFDRDNVWLIQNGNMGYLEGDFNMNSGVTVHDVNQLWNLNNGKMTQVP
jgi:hypothetical protein